MKDLPRAPLANQLKPPVQDTNTNPGVLDAVEGGLQIADHANGVTEAERRASAKTTIFA